MAGPVSHLREIMVLNESPSTKSITLLLTSLPAESTTDFNPSLAITDPSYLLSFCASHLSTTPHAFTLAMAEKSAYTELDHAIIATTPTLPTTAVLAENDIYLRYLSRGEGTHKVQFIHPCTMTHIRKYMRVVMRKVVETPQMYREKVKPWIDAIPLERNAWVRKIVDGEAEQGDVLMREDGPEGFVVLPDSKWDRVTVGNLYLLVIASAGGRLKCLRDLKGGDLAFLKLVKERVEGMCMEMYGLAAEGLRLFVHYHPSYYHFHIHVVNCQMEPHAGMAAGQAHLLDDIIDTLELDPEYFARRALTYFIPQSHELNSVLGL
ncbi:hypothetical protein HDU98_006904 [Podochytrium sp. JEL0797]|nr:hypothetical protein HDU98_006904 [Podochytrium sp. JEL0797]